MTQSLTQHALAQRSFAGATGIHKAARAPSAARPKLTVCATYTAEPIADYLHFWLHAVGLDWGVEFTGYRQLFQQLLGPQSQLASNLRGYPIVLLRLEDLLPSFPNSATTRRELDADQLKQLTDEVASAVGRFNHGRTRALLVALHGPSDSWSAADRTRLAAATHRLGDELGALPNVLCVHDDEFDTYDVERVHDEERQALGDVPFTIEAFAALSTLLARRIHMLEVPARKVLVLDCDNTIWGGVVGEDGVAGLKLDEEYALVQRFAVRQAQRGVLVVLCTKNNERDVLEAFEKRTDFLLQREHIVAQRINWQPKSQNIAALARELNLNLDSFVFLDDNPRECAEVRDALPMVLTVQVPKGPAAVRRMLDHLWAFDRPRVTDEDKRRVHLYRQDAQRREARDQAGNLDAFLAGLQLEVKFTPLTPADVERVAQLTQRTNQFNTTTERRSEGQVRALLNGPLECSCVRVSDRFGDYGLVGVVVHRVERGKLRISSFMLSCRVLGRGVEHAVLRELGAMAKRTGVLELVFEAIRSERNAPALTFLDSVAHHQREQEQMSYSILVADACAARPSSATRTDETATPDAVSVTNRLHRGESASHSGERVAVRDGAEAPPPSGQSRVEGAALGERVALRLSSAKAIVEALSELRTHRVSTSNHTPPATRVEARLLDIWERTLQLTGLGVEDDFFMLGGSSLLATQVLAEVQREFDVALALSTIVEAPTIRALASHVAREQQNRCLVRLRPGSASHPAFFFVHDGFGETLLYANLARRLPQQFRVFGLEPKRLPGVPMAHLTIEELGAHYVRALKVVQPHGPYFLGGLCAGGVIALEAARQLTVSGECVALVTLFDSAAPHARKRPGAVSEQRLGRIKAILTEQGAAPNPLSAVVRAVGTLGGKLARAAAFEFGTRGRSQADRILYRVLRALSERERPWPSWLPAWSVPTLYTLAVSNYVLPPGAYARNVVLVRATHGEGNDLPHRERYLNEDFDWGGLLGSTLHVVDVEAGHSSMLQEPHVTKLAAALTPFLAPAAYEQPNP
jgi:FkbH-like protein